ncbi:HNH endonuclease family protein [Myroides odoratimimus]|uniref:TIGR02646 family protein n=1 Tax=Myroides odoratimimus CIP 101113 TaxID=883154 RepID=A0AAV3F3N5_9FLAO|nr:hypothetical protein [Myroides odoratimimus]EHO12579.1 TIGR02646 family protein [Myroides odoratimimus CIP 101113]
MIKLERVDNSCPICLSGNGEAKKEELKVSFVADKEGFLKKTSKELFDSSIYAHNDVKKKLIEFQKNKCCFCESEVRSVSHGDVEHYRPKGGWCNNEGTEIQKPGYFMLAYDWTNLMFSCQICNQRYKKNFFPLSNSECRIVIDDNYDFSEELPVLLNPYEDNPEEFIEFIGEIPRAIDNNVRGVGTIKYLGLNREDLNTTRRELLSPYLHFVSLLENDNIGDDVKSLILIELNKLYEAKINNKGIFMQMIKDNIGEYFKK